MGVFTCTPLNCRSGSEHSDNAGHNLLSDQDSTSPDNTCFNVLTLHCKEVAAGMRRATKRDGGTGQDIYDAVHVAISVPGPPSAVSITIQPSAEVPAFTLALLCYDISPLMRRTSMNGSVALIIVHDYHQHHVDKIPVQEKIYGERFSHMYHLVPVVPGFAPLAHEVGPNVIPVHGKSSCFQGYIAQGLRHYFREEYTHYLFIRNDVILNPALSEDNVRECLQLDEEDTAFLSDFYALHQRLDWEHTPEAYSFKGRVDSLPTYEEALEKFSAHGLAIKPVSFDWLLLSHGYYVHPADSFLQKFVVRLWWLQIVLRRLTRLVQWPAGARKLAYPLVGGFSGMVVVPRKTIKEFTLYCEALAARNVFAEIGLPTALVLSCKKINTSNTAHTLMRGIHRWPGYVFRSMYSKHEGRLNSLLENFPNGCLFIHPVSLSQWQTERVKS